MLQQTDMGEEEETHLEIPNGVPEGAAERSWVCDTQEEFYHLPSESQEENLECIANEVASIYSQDSDGQVTDSPQIPGPRSPDGVSLAGEIAIDLMVDEVLLQDSGASTGYYPCYHTYGHLPPYQPEDTYVPPKHAGTTDASVQVGVTYQDKASQWEEGGEADSSKEETKMKPCPDHGSLLPSQEKSSGINDKVCANPIDPNRQVLEGLRNGDNGTRNTGVVEGRM
ncbi:UNVERIFIED_CONTAM: hypothetical protein K2H54_009646 [Gekko kuhli]